MLYRIFVSEIGKHLDRKSDHFRKKHILAKMEKKLGLDKGYLKGDKLIITVLLIIISIYPRGIYREELQYEIFIIFKIKFNNEILP